MSEIHFTAPFNNTTAKVYFYKQSKDSVNIDIFIKPTTLDANQPNPLKKVFGGAGLGLESHVDLSGLINGTLYYNDEKELKNEYKYTVTVTTTKDSDSENKPEVFCTIKGQRKEEAKDASGTVTVKYYYFKFVAEDCFSGDDSVVLEKGFTNSAYWFESI